MDNKLFPNGNKEWFLFTVAGDWSPKGDIHLLKDRGINFNAVYGGFLSKDEWKYNKKHPQVIRAVCVEELLEGLPFIKYMDFKLLCEQVFSDYETPEKK